MRLLQFILSHSIFVSLCAAALSVQTAVLLHLPHEILVYALVFCCTLAAYNFYWLVSKLRFDGKTNFLSRNFSFLVMLMVAGVAIVLLLLAMPGKLLMLIPAAGLTLLYTMPLMPLAPRAATRNAGYLKTILLALTWTYLTVILPLKEIVVDEVLLLHLAARFCMMFLLCAVFDMRDARQDKIRGLATLATGMSRAALQRLVLWVFVLYLVTGIALRLLPIDVPQLAAFALTSIAVWWVCRRARTTTDYTFYYFVVDGLMLLSGVLTVIAAMV